MKRIVPYTKIFTRGVKNEAIPKKNNLKLFIYKQAQQGKRIISWTGSFFIVGFGALLTIVVGTGLYYELFGDNSIWNIFNESKEEVLANSRIKNILGSDIKAYSRMNSIRGKPDYKIYTDQKGKRNLIMKYYLESPKGSGKVHLHMIQDSSNNWNYKLLAVDTTATGSSLIPTKRIIIHSDSNKLGGSW